MIGQTLGRYCVIERIGRGGMGEVFLAEDTSLRRRVALKFLPPELQQDADARKRFIREARSAAALDHPYICHINEVADSDGRVFIVMEYVDGQTLRAKIAQGPVAVGDTLQVGIEVAEALEAAHGKGIVHRDIKPENIMLTPAGHAKVMDFGLAKQVGTSPDAETGAPTMTVLTSEGTMVGTPAYMSPEQLRGQAADARSDIWALGVTLHEMASGTRPFQGQSAFELSAGILSKPPEPLPPGVPAELGAAIGRCLEKEPANRYQKARDLRAVLEAIQAGTASTWAAWRYRVTRRRWLVPAAVVTVVGALVFGLNVGGVRNLLTGEGRPFKLAVLPLENLTGDPEQDYLSDGLTQEMISQLSSLHPSRMGVIARASVMRYKKSDASLGQIGRELGVAYVIEGTARREGKRVRISAELIRVRDQAKLWAETYDRELSGILALQSDIARRVTGALALELLPSEETRLARARTVDPEAYEALLKGQQQRQSLTRAGFDAAERSFNLAVEKDPNYAAAWAGIAMVWAGRLQLHFATREEGLLKAKAAALKAIALDDQDPEAQRTLAGILAWLDWDWVAAERSWARLFELEPGDATALPGYAHFLMIMGRQDEAMARITRALELDPHNITVQSFYAVILESARRYDEAIAVARKVLSVEPTSAVATNTFVQSLFMSGRFDELMARERQRTAKDPVMREAVEKGIAEAGYPGAVKRQVDIIAERYRKTGTGSSAIQLARGYARAKDKEGTLEWLEKAVDEHDNNCAYLGVSPIYSLVHADPRFQALARRVGVPIIK